MLATDTLTHKLPYVVAPPLSITIILYEQREILAHRNARERFTQFFLTPLILWQLKPRIRRQFVPGPF